MLRRICLFVLTALTLPLASASGQTLFEDDFDGAKLDEKTWEPGGWYAPLHTVRDGSLRLVVEGIQHHAEVVTRRGDFDFFSRPLTVTLDLTAGSTLAGPYPASDWGKVYAGLSIGPVDKEATRAELGLTAWANEFPQDVQPGWFYTVCLGQLKPDYPKDDWRITGVPRRITWVLDATNATVVLEGATFADGSAKRTAPHGLEPKDFAKEQFRLRLYVSPHWRSMEPGMKHVPPGVLYAERVSVAAGADVPQPKAGKAVPVDQLVYHYKPIDLGGKTTGRPQCQFGLNYAGGNFRDTF